MKTNSQWEKTAEELMKGGLNWAQATIKILGEDLGLDVIHVLKMATPLGGGVARWGTVCGAVSGGALMLGSFFGITKAEDAEEKAQRDKNYAKVQEMIRQFEKNFGTIQCRDIIQLNLLDPEDRKKFEERNVRKQCAQMVAKNLENIRRLIDEK